MLNGFFMIPFSERRIFLQLILGHYVLFYLNFVDKCNMIFS